MKLTNLLKSLTNPNSHSLIDMVMTINPEKIVEHDVKSVGIADHYLIYRVTSYKSQFSAQSHHTIEMRNFKNFDADDFLLDLEQCDLSSINGFDDVNDMYEKLKHLYIEVCDKHCPFVTIWVRKCSLPWLSEDIIDNIKTKHYYEKKAHTKGLDIYWQMFRYFRNVLSNSLKIANRDYYTGMILENKNKPKLMWKCLKSSCQENLSLI